MRKMDQIKRHTELNSCFQNINHKDIKTVDSACTLRVFIAGMLSYYPWWIRILYQIREIFVRIFGLVKHEEPEYIPRLDPEKISFIPGDNVSFFITYKAKENKYWTGLTPEDKHLSAYFGIVAEQIDSSKTRFHVFTTVTYKHWTGPLYFNLIRPFHHFVVWRMMKAGVQNNI